MQDFDTLISTNRPVLVDFYATWCDPCKWLIPILADVEKSLINQATIIKIDIEQNENLKQIYQIQSVPTLILFKNQTILWRMNGFKTAPELTQIIQQFL
ncbi:MAG: thioredoxin [Bacteroidota bacterium]